MKPQVCIPIIQTNDQDILLQVHKALQYPCDLLEIRIDYYEHLLDDQKVIALLKNIKSISQKKILFTCRTKKDGGQVEITDEAYEHILDIGSQYADLIDIEVMKGNVLVYRLVEKMHQRHKKVILSYHDFQKTPQASEIRRQLEHMEVLQGDYLKVAYMPQSYRDVVNLINVTMEMSSKLTIPLITMSMGELGKITRICGELIGSVMTFASLDEASAPGQIEVEKLNMLLEEISCD